MARNLIDIYAKAELYEYQVMGNTNALERPKYKVKYGIELLP